MGENRYYVHCPNCARRLCMAKPNSDLTMECPKCNNIIRITVTVDNSVTTHIEEEVKPSKKGTTNS